MRIKTLFAWVLFFSLFFPGFSSRFFSGAAQAAEMKGVHFADQIQVGAPGAKTTLILNGLGMRLATFLKIQVYVGALYLEKKSSDPAEILASPALKRVEMAFVRGVGAGKLRDAWPDDLKANCSSGCDVFNGQIEQLKSMMTDVSDGDRMAFDFYPDKVDVWIKGKLVGTLSGRGGFSAQLLKDWIGNVPNAELKNGMLGGG